VTHLVLCSSVHPDFSYHVITSKVLQYHSSHGLEVLISITFNLRHTSRKPAYSIESNSILMFLFVLRVNVQNSRHHTKKSLVKICMDERDCRRVKALA
jgi:hypothetical protein